MEEEWTQIVDPILTPTKTIVLSHNITKGKKPSDSDDVLFDIDTETITIRSEFPELKGIDADMIKYADKHGLSCECPIYGSTRLVVKPFEPVYVKENGVTSIKSLSNTFVYVKQGKEIKKLTLNSFKSLTTEKYWRIGWNVQFTVKCRVYIEKTSKCLVLNLRCEEIHFTKMIETSNIDIGTLSVNDKAMKRFTDMFGT